MRFRMPCNLSFWGFNTPEERLATMRNTFQSPVWCDMDSDDPDFDPLERTG